MRTSHATPKNLYLTNGGRIYAEAGPPRTPAMWEEFMAACRRVITRRGCLPHTCDRAHAGCSLWDGGPCTWERR